MNGHSVVFGQLVHKLRYSWVLKKSTSAGQGLIDVHVACSPV